MRILQCKALHARATTSQKNQVAPIQAGEATAMPAGLHYGSNVVQRASDSGGQALPTGLRSGIESLSGMDMSSVRVHYASSRPAQLDALAYAQGSHIHLAHGEEKHLPHEAWHVVQQRQGRVPATMQLGGAPVNDDAGLEREADTMGRRATSATVAGQVAGSGLHEASAQSPVVQRVPIEAKVRWNITHVVEEKNGSLFEGAEIGALGELESGEKLVVDSDDVFVSRRGGNQEQPRNWEADRRDEPRREWYRVLVLKGQDVRAQSLYVRRETITQSDSTNYLEQLVSATNMSNWNARNPDLANAHHKFPKSAIGWLYDHMTAQQRTDLRVAVFLSENAGPAAVARLRSILIAPRAEKALVSSGDRSDDPHNNRAHVESNEAFLDLVHDTGGALTPRSRVVQSLASDVVKRIYLKYQLKQLAGEADGFTIDDTDARRVIEHFRRSEELHYKIELDPKLTSHSSGDAFAFGAGSYAKKPVAPTPVPEGNLSEHYTKRQAELTVPDKARKEVIRGFFAWLRRAPENEKEDLIKCDFAGRKGWIVRYIQGSRIGLPLQPRIVDPAWLQKLSDYEKGKIPADKVDEQMPWLQWF